MALAKNLTFMALTTGMRIGFGMLSFVVLARQLGPGAFGHLMIWISSCMLLSMVANFGMTPYLLREIAKSPHQIGPILAEALTAKVGLSAAVLAVGWLVSAFMGVTEVGYLLILIAFLLDAASEIFNVALRASSQYRQESKLTAVSALVQFALIAATAMATSQLDLIAAAYLCSRVSTFAIVGLGTRPFLPAIRRAPLSKALLRLRQMISFAVDYALQNLFGYIDAVILGAFGGAAMVGVYQAGMRLFQGAAQSAGILVNVFLPMVASATAHPDRLRRETQRMQIAFMITGCVIGAVFLAFAYTGVSRLFGPGFERLDQLFPLFGVLFFVRFSAASFGVTLTALGQQHYRAVVNAVQWALILGATFWVVPNYGNTGWLLLLIGGNALLLVAYGIAAQRRVGVGRISILIFGLGVLMFGAHYA